MRKNNFAVIAALVLTLLIAFGGCVADKPNENDNTGNKNNNGMGGSDIATEIRTTQAIQTEPSITAEDKLIALTFDDGPNYESTSRILDILESNNAHATFFVVGYNIEKNIEVIKRAQAMGCEIGNHTDGHKTLTKCDYATLRSQVDKPNETIKSLTGKYIKLFRAPGGAFKNIKKDIGMPLIQWSIDTEDWKFKDATHKDRTEQERNAELRRIADEVIQGAKKGDIVLMHDIYNFTADLCELIIPELSEKGFKLVTVSEMFDAYGEKLVAGEVYRSVTFKEESTAAAATQSNIVLEVGTYTVKTSGSLLNVRIEPKQDTDIVGKLVNGSEVTVIKSISGWAFIKSESFGGWVNSAYLEKK